jgi:cysteine desulfurase
LTDHSPLIYLDYHATTPLDPRVLEDMLPYLRDRFGNAASHQHACGWQAAEAVELARRQVARFIGAEPVEIVFTSGATESINLALCGVARAYAARGHHLVSWTTEHKATLDTLGALRQDGYEVSLLGVDGQGMLDPRLLEAALREDTLLVSLLAANNEIGVIQPIGEVSRRTRERGVLLHIDAAQAAGKMPIDVNAMGIDLLSLSGHKICGPKGVGALYVRRRGPRVRLEPILHGGGHERGLRSGTLNVPGIVGLGKACEVAVEEMEAEAMRTAALRDRLLNDLQEDPGEIVVHGSMRERLPGNLNLSFLGVTSSELFAELPSVALSSGSACTSANPEPSHVIRALGVPDEIARGAIRFGLGRFTAEEEIRRAVASIRAAIRTIRARKGL